MQLGLGTNFASSITTRSQTALQECYSPIVHIELECSPKETSGLGKSCISTTGKYYVRHFMIQRQLC